MAKIKRLIPFSFWPGHWGLSGDTKAKAYAEYHYDGEDLAYKLLEIKYPDSDNHLYDNFKDFQREKFILDYKYHKIGEYDFGLGMITSDKNLSEDDRDKNISKYHLRYGRITPEEHAYQIFEISYPIKDTDEYTKEKLKLDVKYGKVTAEEADHTLLDFKFADKNSIDFKIAQLELELKYGNIDQNGFEKETATLLHEPWFNYLGGNQGMNGDNVQMAVQLDWNEYFVQFLEKQGWSGATADEVVDKWFESYMKQMLHLEELDGIDDGTEPMPMAGGRYKRDDGLTEYR